MSRLARSLVFAGLVPFAAACSSSATPPGSAPPAVAVGRTAIDGKFAHYLVSPRGDVDGALLEDGTIARFPPGAIAADAAPLQTGDVIHVEGDAMNGPSGRVLTRASIAKGNLVLARADAPPPPPGPRGPVGGPAGGPPGPGGPRGPRDARENALQPMTVTGTIQAFSTDPRGRIDGIVLTDGTSAHGGRKARLDALGLKAGDTITVTGRGGVYPQGRSLHVETVKLPSGEVRTVERPRAELAPSTRDGVITRVLVNPHGDVDGLLLADRTLVRLPPLRGGSPLASGAHVHAEGFGTSTFLEASVLSVGGTAVDLTPPPPPSAPPSPLPEVDDTSVVSQLLVGPEGDTDALVMEDGAIVKMPPGLREDAAEALRIGTKMSVHGEGGTYGGTKSMHARSIALANGQTFADVGPSSPPPPPPDVAP